MSDIFSKEKRSEVMRSVGRKDTPNEVIVRKFLFSNGFRYFKNYKKLPGSPDIVLPRFKTVIFIHGCFWHGHKCKAGMLPKSNLDYWSSKIIRNKERDQRKKKELKELGWEVIEVWECKLKNKIDRNKELLKLLSSFVKTEK